MTEKDFQAQIAELVGVLGGIVYHTYDSRRSSPGFPDLVIVTRDRRLIFAELKVGKSKPTGDQWAWLRALPDHQAYLWRPNDWHDVLRIIQYGHSVSVGMLRKGMIPNAEGLNVRPSRVIQPEPTCICCAYP